MKQELHPQWYALYTRARHEKFVESKLLKQGIEAFTPKVTTRHRWSDRVKSIQEPIFKSYCFARFSLLNKKRVISQTGVAKIVNFHGIYIPVPDSVVQSMKIIAENDIRIDPCPYINIGDTVLIKKGPLKGVEGFVVEKRHRNTSLVISVDAIASAVKCVLDVDCVELS